MNAVDNAINLILKLKNFLIIALVKREGILGYTLVCIYIFAFILNISKAHL